MKVELIYEKTCPNIKPARAQLLQAFAQAGATPHWQEWESNAPETPDYARRYGSPTILVNGRDVAHDTPEGAAACCRIYDNTDGDNAGVPPLTAIVDALRLAQAAQPAAGAGVSATAHKHRLRAALLPAFGTALLPKLTCPACWPAYSGLLSSMGLGFLNYTPYLLPLTAGFILLALASLAYKARQRRGYGPLWLGAASGTAVIAGKFAGDSDIVMYTGVALLVAASLWNTWPRRAATGAACPACAAEST